MLNFYIYFLKETIKPLSASSTNWSNTLKQFVGTLPTNCLSVFDHFVLSALKELKLSEILTLANPMVLIIYQSEWSSYGMIPLSNLYQ